MRVNSTDTNYVSVPFKGGYYMCVEGSKRADALRRANRAWVMGYEDLSKDLLNEALESPGCAFEHRENASKPRVVGLGANEVLDIEALRNG